MLEKEYRKWLEREGYAKTTTAHNSILSTRAAEKIWADSKMPGTLEDNLKPYGQILKRYSRFLRSVPFPRWSAFERFVVDHYEAAAPSASMGSSTKPELTAEQWQRLVSSVCSGEEPADEVLCIVLSSGLEPRAALQAPIRNFGPELAERTEPLRKYKTLAAYLSPSLDSAYKRLQRQLYKHADMLGFDVDFRSIARIPAAVRETARVA